MTLRLIIADKPCDLGEEPFDQLLFWQSYCVEKFPDAISIPELLEINADFLRKRYLALIHDLGEAQVGSLKLQDRLKLRPAFSYWWMTLIVEKCNFAKSPLITDAIKFLAFDEWVQHSTCIKSLTLISAKPELGDCLKNWCQERNIDFDWRKLPQKTNRHLRIRAIFYKLPHIIQAFAWILKYVVERWPLRNIGVEDWRRGKNKLTLISYLFNLQTQEEGGEARFESNYWTKLPNALHRKKIHINWLHVFIKNPVTPSAKSAAKLIHDLNLTHEGEHVHFSLDSFLNIKTIASSVRDYMNIRRLGDGSSEIFSKCKIEDTMLSASHLWPFFKKDWEQSFFGKNAIQNLLTFNLFESAFSKLPTQSRGIYLQENQGWEFGMIHAWRDNRHGQLIGFPHTTVRFWDLRYYFDTRSYSESEFSLPIPNRVAVSGDGVKTAYLRGGYPEAQLIEVEALRYLKLDIANKEAHRRGSSFVNRRKVLVMGDYLASNNSVQMNLLNEIFNELKNLDLTIKSHPACRIRLEDYPNLKFKVSERPLADLVRQFDFAYVGSLTSAGLEAYCAGLKVISVLDPATLNLNPLRGFKGVRFVSSAEELSQALVQIQDETNDRDAILQYFNTDASLSRWLRLLSDARELTSH